MKPQAILLALLVPGAAAVGWLTASEPQALPRAAASATPTIQAARIVAGQARARLLAIGLGAPPEPVAAPQPDVSELFRRDLTAIENTGARPVVWLVDASRAGGRRGLREGDLYRDGWRVSRISTGAIELRRGGENRSVQAFSSAPE